MTSMLQEQREAQLNKATKMKLVVTTKGQSRQLIFYGIVSFTGRPDQPVFFEFATEEEAAECRRLTGWKSAENSTRSRLVYPAHWIEPQGSLPTYASFTLLVDRREEMKEGEETMIEHLSRRIDFLAAEMGHRKVYDGREEKQEERLSVLEEDIRRMLARMGNQEDSLKGLERGSEFLTLCRREHRTELNALTDWLAKLEEEVADIRSRLWPRGA